MNRFGKLRKLSAHAATTLVVLASFDAVAADDVALVRDAAAGKRYDAPGPRRCASTTAPTSGAITAAQARAYVICGWETAGYGGSDSLMLMTKVQVQVASGRPYNAVTDGVESIDTRKKVYDIRGRSIAYNCTPTAVAAGRMKPCGKSVNENNTGLCYQTTFADWRCTWHDFTTPMSTDTRLLIPPPSLAEAE